MGKESMQMRTLQFPGPATTEDLTSTHLVEILEESAYLLEASRESDDPDVREASIDLAIRSLHAASMALGRDAGPAAPRVAGRIVQGPWGKTTSD